MQGIGRRHAAGHFVDEINFVDFRSYLFGEFSIHTSRLSGTGQHCPIRPMDTNHQALLAVTQCSQIEHGAPASSVFLETPGGLI